MKEACPPRDTANRPILIFGAPRSGTSLLSRLLAAHSRISIPFESHFFNQWARRTNHYGDLANSENQRRLIENIICFGVVHDWTPRPVASEVADLVRGPGFGPVATAFMDWAAQVEGKPRWGEKTPHHTLLHRQVFEVWPNAHVLMIQRDPRDVALSWKQARFGGNHVYGFAKSWKSYMEAAEAARGLFPDSAWHSVRYEDLVREPEDQLNQIMSFLGEVFEPGQLGFHKVSDDWNTDARNRAQLRRPISSASIGRWKTLLSPREVRIIEHVTMPVIERCGYAREYPESDLSQVDRLTVRFFEQPVQRAFGIFKNRRGFVYLGRDLNWKVRHLFSTFPKAR